MPETTTNPNPAANQPVPANPLNPIQATPITVANHQTSSHPTPVVMQGNPELKALTDLIQNTTLPAGLDDKLQGMLLRLNKMMQMGSYSKEYESVEQYIRTVTQLPWGKYTPDNLDLNQAAIELNKHHYGLQHVKDMILEYLAVMKLQMESGLNANLTNLAAGQSAAQAAEMSRLQGSASHAPIMCFVGIQGVGKTSIAKSIANALGRKFVRVALGAMGNVTQIRGVARTEPNAEPGQIIKSLVQLQTMNPVILLDEIDKTSSESGLRADLMAALLEILDPEQNSTFVDHYLDYPVDLSRCIFITTANNLGGISAALLDRLEVVRFGSYSDEEKVHIAQNYMLPRVREATGITEQQLSFEPDVWPLVVRPLGFDAGVRQLERTITILARKVARMIVEKKTTGVRVTKDNFHQFIPEDIGVYS